MNKKFLIGSIIAVVLIIGGGVGYYFYNQASADTVFDQNFCAGTTGGGWKNCTQNMSSLRRYMSLQSNGHFRNILNGWASTSFNLNPTSPITNPPTSNPPTGSMTPTAIPTSEPVVTPSNPTVTPTPPTKISANPTPTPVPAPITGCAGATIYNDANFSVAHGSACLAPGSYTEINFQGVGNDSISSIRIEPGYHAILYRDGNYGGPSLVVNESIPNLANVSMSGSPIRMSWNDQVSSMTVYRNPQFSNVQK